MAPVMSSLNMAQSFAGYEQWSGSGDALLWISDIKELEKKEALLTKAAPGKMKGKEKVSVPSARKERDTVDIETTIVDPCAGAAVDVTKVTVSVPLEVKCPGGFELGDAEDFPYVKYIYLKDESDGIVAVHRFRPKDEANSCEVMFDVAAAGTVTPHCYNNLYGLWKGAPLDLQQA